MKRVSKGKARPKSRASHVDWRLIAFFIAGIALSPVAYFGADALAKVTADNQFHISASVGSIGGVVGATKYLIHEGMKIPIKNGVYQMTAFANVIPVLVPSASVVTVKQAMSNVLTAIGGTVFQSGVKPCPFAGWGTSCSISSLTMKRGHHYTFANLKEVTYVSPLADIGWGPDASGSTNILYKYGMNAVGWMWTDKPPSDDYSFSSAWFMGTGELADFTCPKFKLQKPGERFPSFTYIDGYGMPDGTVEWGRNESQPVVQGGVYCMVNHDTTQVVKLKVNSIASTSIKVALQWVGSTGLKTYGCADGLCNEEVHNYCVGCTTAHLALAKADLPIRTNVKRCVDAHLNPPVPRIMTRLFYPDSMSTSEFGGTLTGFGNISYGFEGRYDPNETRVTKTSNIQVMPHEMIHQYTHSMITDGIQSWLDEGLSIAVARTLNECDPKVIPDFYRYPTYADVQSGATDPSTLAGHSLGSAFFEGLETEYACDANCVYSIWNALAQYYAGGTGRPSIWGITNAIRTSTGINPTNLMKFLKIDANDQ